MSKPVCLVTAPVATRSGYGAHSRDIVRALIKLDRYDIKIYSVRWGNCPMNALNESWTSFPVLSASSIIMTLCLASDSNKETVVTEDKNYFEFGDN